MILYVKGDLFQSPAQVLVNAVNTVGVMGKGIALEFKRLYPEMFAEYQRMCEAGKLDIGTLHLYKTSNKWILNFPTKKHWKQPSRLEYIEAGLKKFVGVYSKHGIHSIAFPPIGCGNGQLDFATQVQPLLEKYLRDLPIEIFVYPERENSFVEHIDQTQMRKWLRAEPESLPFSEVWNDLRGLLETRSTFLTVAQGSQFTAQIVENPVAIQITTKSTTRKISYDSLVAVWQQLRSHGFSMRQIVPDLNKHLSYIIPIFAELEYVTPVEIAEQYEGTTAIGLQVLPSAFIDRRNSIALESQQMSLFS